MVKTVTGFIHSSAHRGRVTFPKGKKKGPPKVAKRIYVGGLPYSTTDQDLEAMFTPSGQVNSATVVSDRYSGQSKGFGFVEMENEADANKAINALNGTMMNGRSLTVNEA